jgi:S1-C subfamily serine protease
MAAGAAALALIAVVAAVTLTGSDSGPSTEQIVADVTPSTVLVRVAGAGGAQAAGSGWVLDAKKGLVVTNFHVVNGVTGVTVTSQKASGDAKIVGAAPCEDLAVLKVSDTKGLKTLPLGSQKKLKQGADVVAIGYPANASNEDKLTSTAGVVSVVESSFRFDSPDSPNYANVVQTDAALNPGNSGGPLVDKRKQLVGVNTAILTSAQGAPIGGQGYAIGVDRVKTVTDELRKGHSQAWAGFGFLFATDRQARKQGIPTEGIVVSPPLPGTSAAAANIGPQGALLLAIDGQTLKGTLTDYCQVAGRIEPGQTVPVTLLDKPGAKPRTVQLKFG